MTKVDVVVGTVALAALQLSTSPTPSIVRILFVTNATSAAVGTSGCVRIDYFYTRRNLNVCPHVGILNYIALVGSS